jgi:hypothetical protein
MSEHCIGPETKSANLIGCTRIHGTPGYPITVTAGITFRFFGK